MRRPLTGAATILHADLDAFYASVEQLLDPTLRGRPIAVGSGVVLAASYEARRCGVRAGMAASVARRLCPGIRFAGGHFGEYQRLGDRVIDVFHDFTPLVERVSIDEAFLDVGGAVHLFGEPVRIADSIRKRVRAETGLAVSIGVARTKHLAKVASQVAKPDGLVVVAPDREQEFLDPLPVGLIWGVGPVTEARLSALGIRTVSDLARTASPILRQVLGRSDGEKLASLAANIDARRVEAGPAARSVGAQSALGRRRPSPELVREALAYLSDRVASRLRAGQHGGRTVTVRVRFADMRSVTRSSTLRLPVTSTRTLAEVAIGLAQRAVNDHPDQDEISLLGVSVSNLVDARVLQLELPVGSPGSSRRPERREVDTSVDSIRARFGRHAIGYAAIELSGAARVPEAFRELAER
jgi:DNA polymerase-4